MSTEAAVQSPGAPPPPNSEMFNGKTEAPMPPSADKLVVEPKGMADDTALSGDDKSRLEAAMKMFQADNPEKAEARVAMPEDEAPEATEEAAPSKPTKKVAKDEEAAPAAAKDDYADVRKQLLDEKKAIAEERAKFAKEMEELQELRKLGELGKTDIAKVFDKLGLTPEEVAVQASNGGKLTPAEKKAHEAMARVEALEKAQKDREATWQQQQRAANEQAFTSSLTAKLEGSETHELTKALGGEGVQSIKKIIEAHYLSTIDPRTGQGEEMAFDKAADMVETYLEKQLDTIASKSKKFKTKYGAAEKAEAPTKKVSEKTLSSAMSAKTATKELTPEQRYQRALDMLRSK